MASRGLSIIVVASLVLLPLTGCLQREDGDGLSADVERGGWVVITIDNECREHRELVTSDPQKTDTDGDGVNDFAEFQLGTNPRSADSDGDGIKEGPTMTLDEDDPRLAEWRAMELLERPEGSRTFPGEQGFTMMRDGEQVEVRTDALKANTDSCPDIHDRLPDREEIEGWTVVVGGTPSRVWSHPGIGSTDTDGDGLHDGFEKAFRTDPWNEDTDGDGVDDLRDAFPLCDARLVFEVPQFELKNNKDPEKVTGGGGADLVVTIYLGELTWVWGPESVPMGTSRPGSPTEFDLPDEGTGLPANDRWQQQMLLEVTDRDQAGGDDRVRVKGGDNGHQLIISYNATTSSWTGDAANGVAEGPDARMELELRTVCE